MKAKSKKIKNSNLDERQEQELSKIERNGFWLAFWGLFIIQAAELIITKGNAKVLAGEWAMFMILCLYMSIGCIRKGIWDRKLKPNTPTNAIAALIGATIAALLMFGAMMVKNQGQFVGVSLLLGGFVGLGSFILIFLALQLSVVAYKKKLKKLEEEPEDEE